MYNNDQTIKTVEYIKSKFNVEPEFLWPNQFPSYSVFRCPENKKWFALVGIIPSTSLKLDGEKRDIEIINLRFDKGAAQSFAEGTKGVFPAYHMDKRNWITILLDGTMKDDKVFELIDNSHEISIHV